MTDNETSGAKRELAEAAREPYRWSPMLRMPSLALRGRLIQFAIENGLEDEGEALLVVSARYFRMADTDRFAGWFNGEHTPEDMG